MRQVGIFAAAGLHALEHHLAGLHEDHANARLLAERIASSPRVELDLGTVQTNIVVFTLRPGAPDAASVVFAARARGVWVNALGPRTIRALTHRDVTRAQCLAAAEVLVQSVETGRGPAGLLSALGRGLRRRAPPSCARAPSGGACGCGSTSA